MVQVVSGTIAVILLGLYGYAIKVLVQSPTAEPIHQIATVLNLVGGLVSALIVSVLAITPPAGNPARSFLRVDPPKAVTIITWAYVGVWLVCGCVLLFFWMRTT